MAERVQIAAKKPETKSENLASRAIKSESSQSIRSPLEQILFLQRTIGNQAVQSLVISGGLQAKLSIGQSGDKYEQEADRVANAVMRIPELGMQRQPIEEEVEELQAKATSGHISEANPNLESHIQSLKGGGQPLAESERAFFEPRFGSDFNQVRVHTGAQAAESAQAVNARAFTVGRDVVFGAGQYAPGTSEGRRLLAHELTHVVQNREAHFGSPIRCVCSPPQTRANSDPNEGQRAGGRQLQTNPCLWILYGFHIDSSEFTIAFTPVVNQLAEFLRANSRARLKLLGLNDCFGSDAHNTALGNMRSLNVKNAFPYSSHSRITQLPSNGRGYLVPNDTPLHRAINRTVQIEVIPPPGTQCPNQIPLERQLTPAMQAGCSARSRREVATAARFAVPLAIAALARVRNWSNNSRTQRLLDLYYRTTNDAERQAAANRVAAMLNRIIPNLQRPVLDCVEPGHWAYSRICPSNTFADSGGVTVVQMPTFCIPQFLSPNLNPFGQAVTVIHELSHRLGGTSDHSVYYTPNECLPTTGTTRLTHAQRLTHADSFSCFVGMVAR